MVEIFSNVVSVDVGNSDVLPAVTDSDTLYELPTYLHQRSQNHFSHSVRVIETAAEDIPQRPLSRFFQDESTLFGRRRRRRR